MVFFPLFLKTFTFLFIWKAGGETEINFFPLVFSPNVCISQGWSKLTPRAKNVLQIQHVCTGAQVFVPASAALQGHLKVRRFISQDGNCHPDGVLAFRLFLPLLFFFRKICLCRWMPFSIILYFTHGSNIIR